MEHSVFIITIDTEGDNIWSHPKTVTTRNALYLPRFQYLCEKFGFKPTYLVNYEMAADPVFQQFGFSLLQRKVAEIGLHVHPWNSPPFENACSTQGAQVYLYELPDEILYAKLEFMTGLLTEVFGIRPLSHRAGRWGFDERVAQALCHLGYRVDCSVTPGVSWRKYKGAPEGHGGSDYSDFPPIPYFLDQSNIKHSGSSHLLEIPVTIRSNYPRRLLRFHHVIEDSLTGKIMRRLLGDPYSWLRPDGQNITSMLSIVDWVYEQQLPVLEFVLHSSELMPGGSPTFNNTEQIEMLYAHLDKLFSYIASLGLSGITLTEYRCRWDSE